MTRVLGIDPGLASTGWGLVETDGSRYTHIGHGVIETPANTHVGLRLRTIFQTVEWLIAEYAPDEAGVESLYFARNATSAIPVAQARGVVFLALSLADVPAYEYPPQAIKQSIVGEGRAEKSQVQELVRVLLGLSEIPRPDHSADALAAAICHIAHRPLQERISDVQ
ncbi:MAG: crossover junction endodeoxyribonuclease RuvC [Spirochaetota bacterium]